MKWIALALTLGQVLERVPGLTAATAYFTDRSIIVARGDQTKINGGHILFLINGRPTREVLEGGLVSDLLESFPVNALERIEVIRGSGSVLYGSNAFTAVVNLITRKADRNELVLMGAGGTPGGVASSAEAMYQRGDLSVVGAAQVHQDPEWATAYRYRARASAMKCHTDERPASSTFMPDILIPATLEP